MVLVHGTWRCGEELDTVFKKQGFVVKIPTVKNYILLFKIYSVIKHWIVLRSSLFKDQVKFTIFDGDCRLLIVMYWILVVGYRSIGTVAIGR
jgi:hypothetical protein